MKNTGFRLIPAAIMALVLMAGPAMAPAKAQDGPAQQNTTRKVPQVFNGSGNGNKNAAAPIFVPKAPGGQTGLAGGVLPSQKAYGMKKTQVTSPSSPEAVRRAQEQFKIDSARQVAINKQIRETRMAEMRKNFEADKARNLELLAQRMGAAPMAPMPAAPGGTAASPQSAYSGSTVVFTGKKKDGDEKPPRLFNTR